MSNKTNPDFGNADIVVSKSTLVDERTKEIEAIELTESEVKYALWIGKTNKYHRERTAEYWATKEAEKPGKPKW